MESRKKNKSKKGMSRKGKHKGRRSGKSQSRLDQFGRYYGGTIESLSGVKPREFSPRPKGPLPGAEYSTAQMVNTFASNSGITAGSATAPPFVSAAPTTNSYFAIGFELNDLDQVASLTALYDQYRIDKVELKIMSADTSINVMNTASPNGTVPFMLIAIDSDDNNAPTSLAYMRQYDQVETVTYGNSYFVTVKPSVTPANYASSAFDGYSVVRASWLDSASPAIVHYGVKGAINALTGASTSFCQWQIFAKYFLSFRSTH